MNLLESKKEYNNILLRKYYSSNDKAVYYNEILNFNSDLIDYTLINYFPDLKIERWVYEIGVVSIIKALENYKMDQIADFEDFIVANIKNDIGMYIKEIGNSFEINRSFNIGDIFYSKFHFLKETIETKNERDNLVVKVLKLDKKI